MLIPYSRFEDADFINCLTKIKDTVFEAGLGYKQNLVSFVDQIYAEHRKLLREKEEIVKKYAEFSIEKQGYQFESEKSFEAYLDDFSKLQKIRFEIDDEIISKTEFGQLVKDIPMSVGELSVLQSLFL